MKNSDSADSKVILLADDNGGDARLVREALNESTMQTCLFHVRDGIECMEFLTKKNVFREMPTPDLVLLDLNMPRMNGVEVLKAIEELDQAALNRIPVIILTTSDSPSDIERCYNTNANCYITKPAGYAEFSEVIQSIQNYWFNVASLAEIQHQSQ